MKRKFIDERGRIFGVISALDILVVAVVIVLGAMVYMRFAPDESNVVNVEESEIVYQLAIRNTRAYAIDAYRVGDKVYSEEYDVMIGEITDVSYGPATVTVTGIDGQIHEDHPDGRYDILLTIRATGRVLDGIYYVSRVFEIGLNYTFDIYTKYAASNSVVWSIEGV